MTDRRLQRVVMACILISGFCGLLYEVLWMRAFALVFGNTLFATSFILSIFMGGLAIGSHLFGRWAQRWDRPATVLRAGAALELGIGLWAFALLESRTMLEAIVTIASRAMSPWALALVEASVGALLLLLPTVLMGGTLPIFITFFAREHFMRLGREAGRVYAINTLGAALGSLSAGSLLIPTLGLRGSQIIGAALNLLTAFLLLSLARALSTRRSPMKVPGTGDPMTVVHASSPRHADLPRRRVPWLLIFFLSGFTALLYEVAYTRILAVLLGPTVYAFSLMLTTFILGLAGGSRLLASRVDRWSERADGPARLQTLAAGLYLLIGLAVATLLPLFNRLPLLAGEIARTYADHYLKWQLLYGLLIAGVLLLPATLSGASFPLLIRLYVRARDEVSARVGRAIAVNTAGAIAGPLLAGFLFIPRWGTERTFWIGIALNGITGMVLLLASPLRRRIGWAAVGILLLFLPRIFPRWDVELLSAGLYKYAPYYANVDLEIMARRGEVLYHREGANGMVTVRRVGREHMLAIDGKVDASDGGADMLTQKLLAHLPLLLSDRPHRVGIVGLGSGVTVGAALKYPVEHVDVMEISPQVIEAARFFEHVTDGALRDPRVRLIRDDARRHLRLTSARYDVLISEPSNPWIAGLGALFTREFFALMRARLTERGLVCQWFHSYNMSLRDLKTLLRTFHVVFPRVFLWALNENDLLLIGTTDVTFDPDPTRLEQTFHRAEVRADLLRIGVADLYSLLSLYVMRDADLERFTRGVPLHTDDHPILEFSTPRFLHAPTGASNLRALLEFPRALPPPRAVTHVLARATWEQFQNKGQMYERAESFAEAFGEYRRALEQNPRAREALAGLRRTARTPSLREEAERIYEALVRRDPQNDEARVALAAWYADQARYHECLALFPEASSQLTTDPRALEQQAACLVGIGQITSLDSLCQKWLRTDPENGVALYYLALARFHQGELADALALAQRSVRVHPRFEAQTLVAMIHAERGDADRAEALFDAIARAYPEQALAHYNYGLFLLNAGRAQEAIPHFHAALERDPAHVESYVGLAEAFRQKGRRREARRWAERALRLDPHHALARKLSATP